MNLKLRINQMSLKLRIILLISGLIGAVLLIGVILTVYLASADIRREIQSTLQLAERMLDSQLANSQVSSREDLVKLDFLTELTGIRHLRIEVYDAEDKPIAFGESDPPQSRAPEWFSRMLSTFVEPIPPVERRFGRAQRPWRTIRLIPDPAYEIEEIWSNFLVQLALAAGLFLALNGAAYWLLWRSLKPIDRVLAGFDELEQGKFGARLPAFNVPELNHMGQSFNRLATTLEQSTQARRALTQKLLTLQEQERRSLARELHDEMGQNLSAIQADAYSIASVGRSHCPQVRESAEAIVEVAARVQDLIRSMLHRLRPPDLDELGLIESVRGLLSSWNHRRRNVEVHFRTDGNFNGLQDPLPITVYRIVQESLTNVARHSNAVEVEIELSRRARPGNGCWQDWLCLKVSDNGNVPSTPNLGFGLLGIRERVEGLGGTFRFDHGQSNGVALNVELPVKEEVHERN
ncbi:MAG: histidine kinase [Burkholderiales bacterium]